MDGDRLRVDTEQLADVMSQMEKTTAAVDNWIDESESTVNRLHIIWTGDAAHKHAEAHERWTQAARRMHEALNDLHELGTTAHANYSAAIEANLKMWRR